MKKFHHVIVCFLFSVVSLPMQSADCPTRLTVDLIEHADRVWKDGYMTGLTLNEIVSAPSSYQTVQIASVTPAFGWVVNDCRNDILQTAFRLLVATDIRLLEKDSADMWDSGVVSSQESVYVPYRGKPLQPSTVYYWKVKSFHNGQESGWSEVASFLTASRLQPYGTAAYPIQKTIQYPRMIQKRDGAVHFLDFGKDAFGQLSLTLSSDTVSNISIHIGECVKSGAIDRSPGGSRRYARYELQLMSGTHTYRIVFRPDARNTGAQAIKMPAYIGEVYPFRYCEIENYKGVLTPQSVQREMVHYPFNDEASDFVSSDDTLNQIWELCKYSIKATSFAGLYVDGDRERIPYEADALINQLCHYSVDREFSMARNSYEYLLFHPTWPTEWTLQSVLLAWNDYLYTGNPASLRQYYDLLKNKTLSSLAGKYGFISTVEPEPSKEALAAVHLHNTQMRDIVDWPHTGILGLGKNEAGETDGYEFKPVNTVVNAFHYRTLVLMAQIAAALGKAEEAAHYLESSEQFKKNFNRYLFDKKKGGYVDGIGSDHLSQHGNMFPLAFGLVDKKEQRRVVDFIVSRGMACSVYGSQFLLEALYEADAAAEALNLLTSTGERSWYNMIRVGSTISLEAWDNKYKPNQDWNHAWGAAPANIIVRKLMGIEPLLPGYAKVRIAPQPATLEWAEVKVPTVRGEIESRFNQQEGYFELNVKIPANMEAAICLPCSYQGKYRLLHNGESIKFIQKENRIEIPDVGSGIHSFVLKRK